MKITYPGVKEFLGYVARVLGLGALLTLAVVGVAWLEKSVGPKARPVEDSCLVRRVEDLEHRAAALERRMIERAKERKP